MHYIVITGEELWEKGFTVNYIEILWRTILSHNFVVNSQVLGVFLVDSRAKDRE